MNSNEVIYIDFGIEEIADIAEEDQPNFFWEKSFEWLKNEALREIQRLCDSFSTHIGWQYWFALRAAELTGFDSGHCERLLTDHPRYEEFIGFATMERAIFILKVVKVLRNDGLKFFNQNCRTRIIQTQDIKSDFEYNEFHAILVYVWSLIRSDDTVNRRIAAMDYWKNEKFIVKCVITYLTMLEEWKKSGRTFDEQFETMWEDLEYLP